MVTGSKVAAVYAEALLGVADEDGSLREMETELFAICEVLLNGAEIWAYFRSPVVEPSAKVDLLKKALSGKVRPILLNFLCVLARRRRMEILPGLPLVYSQLLDAKISRRRVQVRSVRPLESSEEGRLREVLSNTLKAEIELQAAVDPELVGGLVISAGDLLFDGSVARKLALLREAMLGHKIFGEEYYEN